MLLATVRWDGGAGDLNWHTAANWDGDTLPAATDQVVIDLDATFAVNLAANATVAGLTIGGQSGSQTLSVGSSITVTVNGPAIIASTSKLILNESSRLDGTGSLVNRGTLESRHGGTINLPFQNATANSVLRFGNDSTGIATLRFSDGFTNHGLIEFTSFSGSAADLVVAGGAGTVVNSATGRIHVVPGASQNGHRRMLTAIDNQGTIELDHSVEIGNDIFVQGSQSSNAGSILVQSGTLTMNMNAAGSSFTSTGVIDVASGHVLHVVGGAGHGGAFSFAGGSVGGRGTLRLEQMITNLDQDLSNAEIDIEILGFRSETNGPGALHLERGETVFASPGVIRAPVINDAIMTVVGAGRIDGPFTANPGSTLRISGDGCCDFGTLTFATAFTNRGVIELTNVASASLPASLVLRDGVLINASDGVLRALAGNFGGSRGLIGTVDNRGLIEAIEVDLTLQDTLTTSGRVQLGNGRTLRAGNLEVAADGIVQAEGRGTIITGSITGAANDPTNFNNLDLSFNSILEVMSEDRGPTSAGFHNNFAFETITTSGQVQLTDVHDNSPGTREALYVDTLVVPDFSVLDVNGLNVYVRALSIGTFQSGIIKGTVHLIGDGGPIELNTLTPGNIGSAGERDRWEFFGRAGQQITVVVKTGGAGPDAPAPPALDFAQIELTDANQTPLGNATNAAEGDDALLLSVLLPADGVYHVFVSAPPGDSSSNENYRVGVFNATVRSSRIVFNEPTVGEIDHAFATERWTFGGTAGQTVRLDLLALSHANIRFALRGPTGSLFESVSTDTIVALPAHGEYELIVGATEPGAYRFQLDDIAPTELTLGVPFAGQITTPGHAQLFRLSTAETQALSILFDATSNAGHSELYAKLGSPPTRSDFQFASKTSGAADQHVLVPAAVPGDWFILVFGESVPEPSSFTLLARVADVFINAVHPNRIPEIIRTNSLCDRLGPLTLVIDGAGFGDVVAVDVLSESGSVLGSASLIEVESRSRLRAKFEPEQMVIGGGDRAHFEFFAAPGQTGPLSLRVRNRDGSAGVLANAVERVGSADLGGSVTQCDFADPEDLGSLRTKLILPENFRPTGVQTLWIEYENQGVLPLTAPILVLQASQRDQPITPIMTLDASIVSEGFLTSAIPAGFSSTIQFLASGDVPGVIQPGERVQVPVYLVGFEGGIPFGVPLEFTVHAMLADNDTPVAWSALKESLRPSSIPPDAWDAIFGNYQEEIGSTAGRYVRELGRNAVYLAGLGQPTSDVNDLFGFDLAIADGMHVQQALAMVTDARVETPGDDLQFHRMFGNTIASRYRAGVLGRGWTHSWETNLAVGSDGTVIIREPGGRTRAFSQTGDHSAKPAISPNRAITDRFNAKPMDRSICAKPTGCCGTIAQTESSVLSET